MSVSAPAITVEVLPAGYGDCLLVNCPTEDGTWRLLVDTGPDETWPLLKARLAALPLDRQGKRHIDLVIISHIDHDHIGAARLLFSDTALNLSFGDVWFNARPQLGTRGVAEGEGLAALLGTAAAHLPWNVAWGRGPVVTPGEGEFKELAGSSNAPTITLLSPTPERLQRLARTWDRELARLRRGEREPEPEAPAIRGPGFPDLELLAARETATDKAPANGSSIAMLLEHQGASVLLGADAFPTVLAAALRALGHHRRVSGALPLDAIKVSHHGSRANLTAELLQASVARHYIISTNNAVFGLPNDEALARIVLHGGPHPTIWFNYGTASNSRWADPALIERYGFDVKLPSGEQRGVTLRLPARPKAR